MPFTPMLVYFQETQVHSYSIRQGLSSCVVKALLSFHALTGCDIVSHLAGHTNKAAWKVFQEDSHLFKLT